MFSDKFLLTQAVLEGRKTMIRRIVPQSVVDNYMYDTDPTIIDAARFEIDEIVAIAQSYKEVNCGGYPVDSRYDAFRTAYSVGDVRESDKGWNNKMFVAAKYMPHHIRITDIKVERLQDISDKDCLREGIFQTRPTSPLFGWGLEIYYGSPRDAFAALIDKVSGKGTWEKNPWVFCYEFELID